MHLRLYVAGRAPSSLRAEANLRAVLASRGDEGWSLEVIDVLRLPERALSDGILVTPTLVCRSADGERRVVGDLHQHDVLAQLLGPDGQLPAAVAGR